MQASELQISTADGPFYKDSEGSKVRIAALPNETASQTAVALHLNADGKWEACQYDDTGVEGLEFWTEPEEVLGVTITELQSALDVAYDEDVSSRELAIILLAVIKQNKPKINE